MKFNEVGFRALYHKFTCFPLEVAKSAVENFPGFDDANCILTYGYIDSMAGLTLEVVMLGVADENGCRFFDTRTDIRTFIRIEGVKDEDFSVIDPNGNSLMERYAAKIEALHNYDVDEEVEKSREIEALDVFRFNEHPDDVMVKIFKKELGVEGCWVRIIGLGNQCLVGELLNEPYQNFNCHAGDKITFFLHKLDDETSVLICDIDKQKRKM